MDGPAAVGPPILGPVTQSYVWSPDGTRLLWLQVLVADDEVARSTLRSVGAGFREPPAMLLEVDFGFGDCAPSWQRLEP